MTRKLKRQGQIWIRVFPDFQFKNQQKYVWVKQMSFPSFWICRIQKLQKLNGIPMSLDLTSNETYLYTLPWALILV